MKISAVHPAWALLCAALWFAPATGLSHGAYHDVVTKLAAEIAQHPDDPGLHYRLACAHQGHAELQPTLEELAIVERLAPGKFDTRLIRGLALAEARRWADARVEFDAVLAGDSRSARALAGRAEALLHLNQPEAAIADGRKAAALDPKNIGFFTRWSGALRMRNQPAEALAITRQGLEQFPKDPALLILALELETAQKDFDAALTRVAVLQECWPRPEPWMQRRAELLAAAGRSAEARTAWNNLRKHILALPNLERANPSLKEILARCDQELGIPSPPSVIAPPVGSGH